MRQPFALLVVLGALASFGCLGPNEDVQSAPPGPSARLVVQVEPDSYCGQVGTIEFFIQARRVECLEDTPCVGQPMIDLTGPRVSCPSVEPTILLGIEIREPGRYAVNLVAVDTTGEREFYCLAPAPELADIVIEVDDLEANAQFDLVILDTPCNDEV